MDTLPIDVIIPCWGGRYTSHLGTAIRSTSRAANHIVVGDEEALAVARGSGATTLLEVDRRRPGPAREQGLDAATHPFVLFLDSDDCMYPGALALLHDTLAAAPRAVAAFAGLRRSPAGGQWPSPSAARLSTGPLGLASLLFSNSMTTVGSCLLRRSRLTPIRPVFPDLEDEDWHAALKVRAAGDVVYVRRVLTVYSTATGTISRRARSPEALKRSRRELVLSAEAGLGRRSPSLRCVDGVARVYRRKQDIALLDRWGRRPTRLQGH